jgi:hypothetical protein
LQPLLAFDRQLFNPRGHNDLTRTR